MSAYVSLAGFYDSVMPEEDYRLWADCCDDLFRPRKINTVLDLACGTGRLSWLLAQRGYEVIGVDLSCDMLAVAASREEEVRFRPLFLNQSLQELDLYGTVQAAICSMDGLNYLSEKDLREALRRIRLFLEPGGLLLFDLNTAEKFRRMDGEIYTEETEDAFCVWRAELEKEEKSCVFGMDIFLKQGKLWRREREEHVEYVYSAEGITAMLEVAGFSRPQVFGGLPLRPITGEEDRLFFLSGGEK
ncbi:MAG: class I SAM-dependent methyltransferase [Stomatobaculum sp.]|nr:class I SAM-dependent methyltransferase [Stomatobaculum sp.]